MGSIPVGQSIGGGYGFLFRRFFTILGLSWLPAAIYALGRLGFLWHVEPRLFAGIRAGEHLSLAIALTGLGYVLFSALVKAVIALPLNRDALGLRDQPVLARLVVGARELRLFGAYIGIGIILIVLLVVLVGGVIGAIWLAKWAVIHNAALANWPVVRTVHIVASVVAILLFLFVALRLSFLIAPIAAIEDRARLSRAWGLSAGNFWRMLAIFVVLMVPLLIVAGLCEYAAMGSGLHDVHGGAILALAIEHGPAVVTIAAAVLVIAAALFAGAGATAYRALQPPPEADVFAEAPAHVEPYAEPAHEPEPVAEEAPHTEEAPPESPAHTEEAAPEEHHAEAEAPAEASDEAAAPAEEPAMELHEPAAPEETHEAEGAPPPEQHSAAFGR